MTAPTVATEPSTLTAEQRLALVVDIAAIGVTDAPELLPSFSNDVWAFTDAVFGRCVLRICWRGDRARLITEARLGRALPHSWGLPQVLSYGWTRDDHDLSWILTSRLDGSPLADVWADLSAGERRTAARQTAARLRALHRWRPSAALTDRLLSWRRRSDPSGVLGATIMPLPWPGPAIMAAAAQRLPGMDPALVDRAVGWLRDRPELAPRLDSPELPVTHGDLHAGNVWWDGAGVVALLDLEWARLGQPYLDLARTDDDDAGREFTRLLLVAYPDLDVPDLAERLRYLRLAHELRQLLTSPPPAAYPSAAAMPIDHPVRRLATLLEP